MELKTLVNEYINTYKKHFENDNRNDATFENVAYIGYLFDRYQPQFTKDCTYYKALYKKCLKAKKENNF